MLFGVVVLCRILYSFVSYSYVSCSGSITSVGEDRLLLIRRGFPFLLVLGMGYVILLLHSLDLPYNYINHCLVCILASFYEFSQYTGLVR